MSKSTARVWLCTFLEESTKDLKHGGAALSFCLEALSDPKPVVRESAVLGIDNHIEALLDHLRALHDRESSEGVKTAIADVLEKK